MEREAKSQEGFKVILEFSVGLGPLSTGGFFSIPMASDSKENPMEAIHIIALIYACKESSFSLMKGSKNRMQGYCSS